MIYWNGYNFIKELEKQGYKKEGVQITTQQKNDNITPLIITDFGKYAFADYKTEFYEMDGFKLGEVVFDQCGEIGVILAFYNRGEVRLNSNGVCNVGNLKKCPKDIAEKELKHMDVLRPEKSTDGQLQYAKDAKQFIQDWRNSNPYPASGLMDDPEALDAYNAKFNRDFGKFTEQWTKCNYPNTGEKPVISYLVPDILNLNKGKYNPTDLDERKIEADILLTAIDGNYYTLQINKTIQLPESRRIKRYSNGCVSVPESVYNRLKSKYNVICDF